MTLGQVIKHLRYEKNMTQEQLIDRVGGGLTAPTSHTTQHAGPHWAVQCRNITSRGYRLHLPVTSFLALLQTGEPDTRMHPVRRLWLSFFGANIRILPQSRPACSR
jgi:hypothetical protein